MLNKSEQKQIQTKFKRGEHIQVKMGPKAEWVDMTRPIWNFSSYEYRERPADWKPAKKKQTKVPAESAVV